MQIERSKNKKRAIRVAGLYMGLTNHVAQDGPHSKEALRSSADVRKPHVIQEYLLDYESRHLETSRNTTISPIQ